LQAKAYKPVSSDQKEFLQNIYQKYFKKEENSALNVQADPQGSPQAKDEDSYSQGSPRVAKTSLSLKQKSAKSFTN
jgi:hypothetical protein